MNDLALPPQPPPQQTVSPIFTVSDHDLLISIREKLDRVIYDQKIYEERNIIKSHDLQNTINKVQKVTDKITEQKIMEQVTDHSLLLRDINTTYKVGRVVLSLVSAAIGFLIARIFPLLVKYF